MIGRDHREVAFSSLGMGPWEAQDQPSVPMAGAMSSIAMQTDNRQKAIRLKFERFRTLAPLSLQPLRTFSSWSLRFRGATQGMKTICTSGFYFFFASFWVWPSLASSLERGFHNAESAKRPTGTGQPVKRWLIVVRAGQADLYAHLVQAFSRDAKVRVILDRRKDDPGTPPAGRHRPDHGRYHPGAPIGRTTGLRHRMSTMVGGGRPP